MANEATELSDRWILPLRGSRVTKIGWDDSVRFQLEPPGEVTVGPGALFTDGPTAATGPGVKNLGQLDHEDVERSCGAQILSAVAFKNGALRVVLDNGWHLNVRAAEPFVPASVTSGGEVIWTRSGG